MTISCENAPVHSELFAYSTLKTMGTGDATDTRRHQQHSAPRLPFSNQVRYCTAGRPLIADPVDHELDHFLLVAEVSARPHTDQLTRVTTHVPVRFRSIHRWLPRACLQVESSADENVLR
jgi:hypothetical protein